MSGRISGERRWGHEGIPGELRVIESPDRVRFRREHLRMPRRCPPSPLAAPPIILPEPVYEWAMAYLKRAEKESMTHGERELRTLHRKAAATQAELDALRCVAAKDPQCGGYCAQHSCKSVASESGHTGQHHPGGAPGAAGGKCLLLVRSGFCWPGCSGSYATGST